MTSTSIIIPARRDFTVAGVAFNGLSRLAAIILANPDANYDVLVEATGAKRSSLDSRLDTVCKLIEDRTGVVVGAKELREIRDQLVA